MDCNRFSVCGELAELDDLRYTPAGVARVAFRILHSSMQTEAGMVRQVNCDIPALALGTPALQVKQLQVGQRVKAEGFLAQRSMRTSQLVLHIDNIILE
uniref:Replication restart protein PriB n=1 Tax=Candidatus Nitrotoga fabula TaxID=2182327 RepID=A0A2X0R8G9_9PROT|nr:Single-strand binding protein/primosomal replication protein N [Candidatus Nitrotoga fabula]